MPVYDKDIIYSNPNHFMRIMSLYFHHHGEWNKKQHDTFNLREHTCLSAITC